MKKLLMIGAILVMGTMAFGYEDATNKENEAEATVTVKAELVAENLVITDLEGNPIVLDFGKVSKTRGSGTSEAQTGYMVRYVGNSALDSTNNALAMTLLDKATGNYENKAVGVRLSEVSQIEGQGDSFNVMVGLNTYSGVMPTKANDGNDYAEYTGTIFGTLKHSDAGALKDGSLAKLSDLDNGFYQGQTMLRVTINGGEAFGSN